MLSFQVSFIKRIVLEISGLAGNTWPTTLDQMQEIQTNTNEMS